MVEHRFLPRNPLSQYNVTGYHIGLLMVSDDLARNADPYEILGAITSGNAEVLVETGSTELTIESLRFKTFAGIDPRSWASVVVEGHMRIVEPGGFSFFDTFRAKAARLGLRSAADAVLVLTISFYGRRVETAGGTERFVEDLGIGPNGGTGRVWAWKILVHTVRSRFDTGGGTYDIEFAVYDHVALYDRIVRLPRSINAEGRLVEEVVAQIQTAINQARLQPVETLPSGSPVEYRIEIVPLTELVEGVPDGDKIAALVGENNLDPNRWIVNSDEPEHTGHQGTTNPEKPTDAKIVLTQGQPIDSAILALLQSTREGRVLMTRGTSERGSTANPEHDVGVAFKVEPVVERKGWNEELSTWNVLVTYKVVPYAWSPYFSNGADLAGVRNLGNEKLRAKIQKFIDKRRLARIYDYIYTGQNTEVIDIEIEFNLLWYVLISGYEDWENYNTQINTLISEQVLEHRRAEASSAVIGEKETKYAAAPTRIAPRRIKAAGPEAPDVIIGTPPGFDSVAVDTRLIGIPGSRLKREDYYTLFASAADTLRDDIRVDTYHGPTAAYASSVTKQRQDRGSSEAALVARAMAGDTPSADMVNITMTIRGDPYWLGEPHGSQRFLRYLPDEDSAAPYGTGEVLFLLRFGQPRFFEIGASQPLLVLGDVTAVYSVVSVEHIFENGSFTQRLEAIRNLRMKPLDLEQLRPPARRAL